MKQEDRIERILESAKGAGQVEPNPYLFNKVLSRLEDLSEEIYKARPALVWLSVSALALLISVNIYSLTRGQSAPESQNLDSVVNYYSLTDQSGLNY